MPTLRGVLGASRAQIVVISCVLAIGAMLRVVLFVAFGTEAALRVWTLPALLVVGAAQDVIVALALVLPISAVRVFRTPVPDTAGWRARAAYLIASVGTTALIYLSVTEYLFFEEFDARFNLVAVDYLRYPTEVFGNISASYPTVAILLVSATAGLAVTYLLRVTLMRGPSAAGDRWTRAGVFAVNMAALSVASVALEPGAIFFISNRVADEIAANGVIRFLEASRTNDVDYPSLYLKGDSASDLLRVKEDLTSAGGEFIALADGGLTRAFPERAAGLGRQNLVIIVEESLGANHVTTMGGASGLTPQFDGLAAQGLLFTEAFATGTRTVRGLEAIVTSFPPIPSESIVRRPGGENVANLGGVLREQGYSTVFTYGGYAYFDDMQRFFEGNGFEVVDRRQMRDVRFANIWGVSDDDLFDNALRQMDSLATRDRPFLNVILTTSNHKPFTFPPNSAGIPVQGGGREAGVRYADYALGNFMRLALERRWAENTVFVVLGDHSARVYGAERIPIDTYRVPVLILAPGRVASARNDVRMSQIDIAPTLLGLLGLGYTAPFFGRDVLAYPDPHRALLFSHNYSVALWRDDRVVVLDLGQQSATYAVAPGEPMSPMAGDVTLTKLAAAYYGTAYDLFRSGRYH